MQKTTPFKLHLEASESRTGRLIGGSMSKFLEGSKFVGAEYHRGKIIVILHLVSVSFLFYGLSMKRWLSSLQAFSSSMRWHMPVTTSSCIRETRHLVSE